MQEGSARVGTIDCCLPVHTDETIGTIGEDVREACKRNLCGKTLSMPPLISPTVCRLWYSNNHSCSSIIVLHCCWAMSVCGDSNESLSWVDEFRQVLDTTKFNLNAPLQHMHKETKRLCVFQSVREMSKEEARIEPQKDGMPPLPSLGDNAGLMAMFLDVLWVRRYVTKGTFFFFPTRAFCL